MNSPDWQVPNMLLEMSGEITPDRMKRQTQRKNNIVLDMTGDGSKVQCYQEQYCVGTQNVRSMNQDELEVVKQEMARVNISILLTKVDWSGKIYLR